MTKEQRERNPEKYEEFKLKQRELMRKRREENPEIRVRDRKNARDYYERNREHCNELARKRYARIHCKETEKKQEEEKK